MTLLINRNNISKFCFNWCKINCRLNFVESFTKRNMTNKPSDIKLYITRNIPERGLNLLKSKGYSITQWTSDLPVPSDVLLREVRGVDALFCLLTDKISKDVIDAAGASLKVVGTMSVGYEHIDIDYCKKRNIPIGYTPNVLTNSTVELTIALLLTTSRRIPEAVDAVKSGEWSTWKPLWMCGRDIAGSVVGIFGLGRIGSEVAKRLKAFGVQKLQYSDCVQQPWDKDLDAHYVSFDELLSTSDFVLATCPLTDETRGIFNASAFKKMKPTAIFINTSRGGVVNQEDLYEALSSSTIWAAGLDVTTPEPLPPSHPLVTLKNCIVLPHIGSATVDTRSTMAELTANNIICALEGKTMPAPLRY